MGEKGQSGSAVSLQHHYMSELIVPKYSTFLIRDVDINNNPLLKIPSKENISKAHHKIPSKENLSNDCTCDIEAVSKVLSPPPKEAPVVAKLLVDCPYKVAGCTEKIADGAEAEKEHCQNCYFRPIPCLMQHACKQLVPYQAFLLHQMTHFIYPMFSSILNTSVFFEKGDFDHNQRWQPRWMNCYGKDFFVMITHNIPGMWYFWVWMMGTPEEALNFSYDVEVSKSPYRKIGTFPVLSVRQSEEELEKQEICLAMTDYQVKRISQIRENLVGTFELDLMILKAASSSANRLCKHEGKNSEI